MSTENGNHRLRELRNGDNAMSTENELAQANRIGELVEELREATEERDTWRSHCMEGLSLTRELSLHMAEHDPRYEKVAHMIDVKAQACGIELPPVEGLEVLEEPDGN